MYLFILHSIYDTKQTEHQCFTCFYVSSPFRTQQSHQKHKTINILLIRYTNKQGLIQLSMKTIQTDRQTDRQERVPAQSIDEMTLEGSFV